MASGAWLLNAVADDSSSTWVYVVCAVLVLVLLIAVHLTILRNERKKLIRLQEEKEAENSKDMDEMKIRFLANFGHELHIPLSLIISPLELLIKEYGEDKELVSKLEVIQRNADRLQNQVNQLLDLNKNDMNRLHLNMAESDVVGFVNNVCSSFTLLSEREKIAFSFSSGVPSLKMSFDKDKLGKAIMNILSNAFKFTDEGGKVDVKVDLIREKGLPDVLEIKVSDTGVGIQDADKEKVFERFYQVHRPGVKSTGSGVGLSFVHDFVTMHGGTVKVTDNLPSGSIFIVHLPMKRPKTKPVEEKEEDEVVVVRAQKGVKPQVAEAPVPAETAEPVKEAPAPEVKPAEAVLDENIDTVTTIKAHKATVIQLTEDEEDKIVTRVIPEEELPEVVTMVEESGKNDHFSKTAKPERKNGKSEKAYPGAKAEESDEAVAIQDEQLVEAAASYVDANISRSDLSVEELSNELGISRVHLYKKMVAITGKTPVEFIRSIRLKHAALLLRETQRNVADVAVQVGISNPKYFSRYFKEEYGVLPSVYQSQQQNANK